MIVLIAIIFITIGITVNAYPVDISGNDTLLNGARIVGGLDAPEGYAPHMAALVWGEFVKGVLCGGSIISTHLILTAAHCIDPLVKEGQLSSSFHAVVGSNLWKSTNHILKFSHYKNHPLWDSVRLKNDIGVLFLIEEVVLGDNIGLVPLSFEWVDGDVPSYVTGWGRLGAMISSTNFILYPFPDKLQLLYLRTLSPQRCAAHIGTSLPTSSYSLDSELEICTLHSLGHGMCYGDSGSPLIVKETGHQIGVASWAFPCARGRPDVFVRLSSYKDFLLHMLRSNYE